MNFIKRQLPVFLIASGLALGVFTWVWGINTSDASNAPAAEFVLPGDQRTSDCGAASLYIICRLAGKETSLDELRSLSDTNEWGTNLLRLKEAALDMGFEVEAYRAGFDALRDHLAKPSCYALLHGKIGHFVAIVGLAPGGRVCVADNVLGILRLSEAELRDLYAWEGTFLLLRDKPPANLALETP